MADKLLAGHAVRRLRRGAGLTQVALAAALDISPSYLNLIERNQRPLSAGLMLRLADRFDFDPRALGADEPGGGMEGMRRRLSDAMFSDLAIDRTEIEEWLAAAPRGAEAFARAFDRVAQNGGDVLSDEAAPIALVRREIERWRNHFADLDTQAEELADELRLSSGDLYGAIAERLRVKHQFAIRILPADVMPDRVRRLDLHARQLQISEMLDGPSRCFQLAYLLGDLEAKKEIGALVAGASFTDRTTDRLFRRHLTGYFAAALMMPYARFLRACESSGYDLLLLQRRFNAGFEQVAHRLTTLQRVGARGLPFFMLRIDRAGQSSKRYAGASASLLVEAEGRCPLWDIHAAFGRPGEIVRQLVVLPDGDRWFTVARTVAAQGAALQGGNAMFTVAVGLKAEFAAPLLAARGLDLVGGEAQPVGPGCSACVRDLCAQRSAPPRGRTLRFDDRERGLSPFTFAAD
ncbi:XRE family transcriptional regulator [Sphingobium sp. SCG-1]|uniref:helix-turn-helix domain-containing protein n=1 Tax=Sphingobium sp. SCG-1 TaxID=2072936 RepID=UPI000CD69FF6|nr:helix-turn-helix transcriptional regulator [Sphingobium sp. SCG-1]AUW58269.1 XRE family transcriptional regulator [Sphingobium sp. SCG-1]